MTRNRVLGAVLAVVLVGAGLVLVTRLLGDDNGASVAESRLATLGVTSTTGPTATTSATTTTTTPVTDLATEPVTDLATTSPPGPSTTVAPASTQATVTQPSPPAPTSLPATAPPATDPPPPVQAPAGPAAYRGLGTWVDAFDFDPAHRANGIPTVVPADVDRMADQGIKTLYIQAARSEDEKAPGDLLRPDLVGQFLLRAHARGMYVVAWFLPHHADVDDDMRHLRAMVDFSVDSHRFDSIALDVEWRNGEADHGVRSARLVEVARQLRAASPDRPVGAIVMPPVVTDVLNTNFWPGYPWAELAGLVDVFLPMSYWTNRSADSPYRDAYRYTADNIAMVRRHVGNVPIHAIGGIGNAATREDYDRFVAASRDGGAIGWSNYDWDTTAGDAWGNLRG